MFGRKKSDDSQNWNKLQSRDESQRVSSRDVYESQQLDRGDLGFVKSKKIANIIGAVCGVLIFFTIWFAVSLVQIGFAMLGNLSDGTSVAPSASAKPPYWHEGEQKMGIVTMPCFQQTDQNGQIADATCYDTKEQVPVPQWYEDYVVEEQDNSHTKTATLSFADVLFSISLQKLIWSLAPAAGLGLLIGGKIGARIDAENAMRSTDDINQHDDDQHIALPQEIQQQLDWFPNAGAHSSVKANAILSHAMLSKKGIKNVQTPKRAEKDIVDEEGNVVYLAGEILVDDNGDPIMENGPMIDEEFGQEVYTASLLPKDSVYRVKFDARRIPYNPDGSNRDKIGKYKSVAEMINNDWFIPEIEHQRPCGGYLVDSSPVNTMPIAITRAGKGQTYIEPMIDVWSREVNKHNMLANDPKGELLVKFVVPLTVRGYDVIAFNLINPMRTDIYNPLSFASQAARRGDSNGCAKYVDTIAKVFFPVNGGEDPVWPNAANAAFKRTVYGLIDYYLEEERELREHARRTKMDPLTLERKLDELWGHVTLYNCYQFFVQMTAKKQKNPLNELKKKLENGSIDEAEYESKLEDAQWKSDVLWEGKAELDLMGLYFNSIEQLPQNMMRTLVLNANNSLKSMAGAEKMLASVYGIAVTAMNFFTSPTISSLTSGRPSQEADLEGLSFPRRIGVQFHSEYCKKEHLIGAKTKWTAYKDASFTQPLGKGFEHDNQVDAEGWAMCFFQGICEEPRSYWKLQVFSAQSGLLQKEYFFAFTKSHRLSVDGHHYTTNPITNEKIVKDGVLQEMVYDRKNSKYRLGSTMFKRLGLSMEVQPETKMMNYPAIKQMSVRYTEKPKAIFVVTPPHLMEYAKLILILIKQLFDLNVDKAYLTESNQKPHYMTRYMLDELGNLQSDGNGIEGLETMLSIGLGQDQQFTLILQTLQQLIAVYGQDIDKIIQGNVANLILLKSNETDMLKTLETMSGTTHRSYRDSKQVTQQLDQMIGGKTSGAISYTIGTQERPVISVNDMLSIAPRNSMVFRPGESPIWNRNETVLPMSWRLLKDQINHPGHEYQLSTVPSLSGAMDFDVRANQPNFRKMLIKQIDRASRASTAVEMYSQAHNYDEEDVLRLDPDVYADEIMNVISIMLGGDGSEIPDMPNEFLEVGYDGDEFVDNDEMIAEMAARKTQMEEFNKKCYAQATVAKSDLITQGGTAKVRGQLDSELVKAFVRSKTELFSDLRNFSTNADGDLLSADGSKTYVKINHNRGLAQRLNEAAQDEATRVFSDKVINDGDIEDIEIKAEFLYFLTSRNDWRWFANGVFDHEMWVAMQNKEFGEED